ncbi:putative D-serine dehydratase-like domain-containing protein [Seiridium unicorne]|uniref:D-serine dehydratase-like domain-containing protein n=1 Tax=Seiridium unicorne TaxID=138068 RepID=A0ABR2V8X9_9PEZI
MTQQAMDNLVGEIQGCIDAAKQKRHYFPTSLRDLTISAGASPQATAIQDFAPTVGAETGATQKLAHAIREISVQEIAGLRISLELHARVYSVLNPQQMATNFQKPNSGWDKVDPTLKSAETVPTSNIIVERISQEHSILSWDRDGEQRTSQDLPPLPLEVGQYVRIYPNHACVQHMLGIA